MVLVTLCKFWLNLLQTVWTADSSAAARHLPSPKGPRLPAPRQHDTLRAHAEHIAKVNACMVLVTPYKFRLNMLQQGQDCRLLGSSATPVKPNGAVYTLRAHAARIAKVNVCMVLVAPLQVLVKYVAQGQDCRLLGSSVTPTKPKRGVLDSVSQSLAGHKTSMAKRYSKCVTRYLHVLHMNQRPLKVAAIYHTRSQQIHRQAVQQMRHMMFGCAAHSSIAPGRCCCHRHR
jgi:hypothetical protein